MHAGTVGVSPEGQLQLCSEPAFVLMAKSAAFRTTFYCSAALDGCTEGMVVFAEYADVVFPLHDADGRLWLPMYLAGVQCGLKPKETAGSDGSAVITGFKVRACGCVRVGAWSHAAGSAARVCWTGGETCRVGLAH